MIFTGQKIPLTTTFTDDGGAVDLTDGTVRFDYWLPSNNTTTPTGNVSGSIVSATDGTATGEIPAATNTIAGCWRVQGIFTDSSSNEWPATVTVFTVYGRGQGTSC